MKRFLIWLVVLLVMVVGGLIMVEPYGLLAAGIPIVLVGFAFIVRSIF